MVKVFAIQDPSLPLGVHRERLEYIRTQLASSFNCLPFQRIVVRVYLSLYIICVTIFIQHKEII